MENRYSVSPYASLKASEMGRFLGITVKRLAPCRCFEEPYESLNVNGVGAQVRSNFFSPPAHLCAVTYITEISLHVPLSI